MKTLYFWYLSDNNFCESENGNTFAFETEEQALAAVKTTLTRQYEDLCARMKGTDFKSSIEPLSSDYPGEYWVSFSWNAANKNIDVKTMPFSGENVRTPWCYLMTKNYSYPLDESVKAPDFIRAISSETWRICKKKIVFSDVEKFAKTYV